jgi:hypothetical protein
VLLLHNINLPRKSGVLFAPLHTAQPDGGVALATHIIISPEGTPDDDIDNKVVVVLPMNIVLNAGKYILLDVPVEVNVLFIVNTPVDIFIFLFTEISVVFGNVILLFAKYFCDIIISVTLYRRN